MIVATGQNFPEEALAALGLKGLAVTRLVVTVDVRKVTQIQVTCDVLCESQQAFFSELTKRYKMVPLDDAELD